MASNLIELGANSKAGQGVFCNHHYCTSIPMQISPISKGAATSIYVEPGVQVLLQGRQCFATILGLSIADLVGQKK